MNFRKDLTGNIYGYWTVLSFDQELSNKRDRTYWKCKCSCGEVQSVLGQNLTSGQSKSCGCQTRNLKKKDLIGKTFGYLTVISDTGKINSHRNVIWKCKCKCGNQIEVPGARLLNGSTSSCGCFKSEVSSKNLLGMRFGKLTVIEKTDLRKRSYIIWKCRCDCGNICFKDSYCLNNGKTNSCGCIKSKGEAKIQNILEENNVYYNEEYTFPDLLSNKGHYLRFDFAIFTENNELSHLIEYNGQQHYECSEKWWNTKETFSRLQENDLKKIQYCKEHNIPLLIIPYTEYETLTLERLMI